jgi:hypothetical protein
VRPGARDRVERLRRRDQHLLRDAAAQRADFDTSRSSSPDGLCSSRASGSQAQIPFTFEYLRLCISPGSGNDIAWRDEISL